MPWWQPSRQVPLYPGFIMSISFTLSCPLCVYPPSTTHQSRNPKAKAINMPVAWRDTNQSATTSGSIAANLFLLSLLTVFVNGDFGIVKGKYLYCPGAHALRFPDEWSGECTWCTGSLVKEKKMCPCQFHVNSVFCKSITLHRFGWVLKRWNIAWLQHGLCLNWFCCSQMALTQFANSRLSFTTYEWPSLWPLRSPKVKYDGAIGQYWTPHIMFPVNIL